MKKIYFMFAAIAVTSFSFVREANAKALAGIAVVRSSETSYKLIYKSENESDVKVQIFDSRNTIVFSETIKMSSGFSRPYNFESLSEGAYTLRVDNGSNWLTETVQYKSGRVEKLAHLTSLQDGRFLLSVPGTTRQRVSVHIYDETGKVIYKCKQDVPDGFAQIFRLNDVKGSLLFEVADETGLTKIFSR
jgi:hypothetical protein